MSRTKVSADPLFVRSLTVHRGRAIDLDGKRLREVLPRLDREGLDAEVELSFKRRDGRIHRCPEVATFTWLNRDRLELRRFPPYAPEMNPDEGIWDVLKGDRLANYCPTSLDELEGTVRAEMRRLKRDPRKVRTAIRQTELPIHELVSAVVLA